MNETCYIKATFQNDKFIIECFNLSVFDVLFIFNNDDTIFINSFYGVDNFGSDKEIHITESEIISIKNVDSLFWYFSEKGEYGEKFTISEFSFLINGTNIRIKDDYLVWFEIKVDDSNKHLQVLTKILYLLNFTEVQSILKLIMNNLNRYVVFKEDESCQVVDSYSKIEL